MKIKYDLEPREYFIDPMNSTDNENIIQLKLGIDWYRDKWEMEDRHNIVQIGNVLGMYGYCESNTVELSKFKDDNSIEKGFAGTIDYYDDFKDYDFTGKAVISLEAFNRNEYNFELLTKITNEASSYFITFTPNSNSDLDSQIIMELEKWQWHGWCRKDQSTWEYSAQRPDVWEKERNSPNPAANGIILIHS